MNTLLLFFALPIATIILAIVIEKIIRNPFLTAATFFAIYLIVAFAAFDANFLVYVIAYTILAFITAIITEFILQNCRDICTNKTMNCTNDNTSRSESEIMVNNGFQNRRNCQCYRR
ncbi:MAG: DUF2651 family protein [Clostridiaceae bacterium]|nr:DUF2651 family protein [Clostridiaceae bacterium]